MKSLPARLLQSFVSALLVGCASVDLPDAPETALQLVTGIQARHRAPTSVTFTQDATTFAADGTSSEDLMHEWISLPGHLRIDVLGDDPLTILFDPEGRTVVRPGGAQRSERISVVMLLMLDVFAEDPARWLARAESAGLDGSVLSTSLWDDRPAFLLGARPGQLDRVQLWVDAETWLPVRYVELGPPRDGAARPVLEGRAYDYRDFDGVPFHTRFEFLQDGVRVIEERYREIVLDAPLDPALFDVDVVAAQYAARGH